MLKKIRKKSKRVVQKFISSISKRERTYKFLLIFVKIIPCTKIKNSENFPRILRLYEEFSQIVRYNLNNKTSQTRENISLKYLIPIINKLFDKNYINFAQITLLIIEEYFLSKNTEKEFEDLLKMYSEHAIAAGLRFREKFPLIEKKIVGESRVGFVGHSVAISGYEVIMMIGEVARFPTSMYTMRVFDDSRGISASNSFHQSGIDLIATKNNIYDVFELRNLMIKYPVDTAIWPMPPFHMFFFFSFGLASKQVWLSQYLRPNLSFKYLDGLVTLGGAGGIRKKFFNNREWNIIPQIVKIEGVTKIKKRKVMFTPARLEKLKQPEFLNCVVKILKTDRNVHFVWTGYYCDKEVVEFFRERNLGARHSFLHWMSSKKLSDQIKASDLILSCFPLSLGTVENIAAHHRVPIVSMFDDGFNMYWRDIYWEAVNGNEELKKICLDKDGNSKILIAKTEDEYVEVAVKVLNNKELAKTYADVYQRAHEYAYFANPNDIGGILEDLIREISQ